MIESLRSFISRRSERFFIGIALLWALGIGVLDFSSGYQARMAPLYLPAIFLIAWFAGVRRGIWLCLGVTLIWFSGNYFAGQRYAYVMVPIWNFAIRFFAYLAFFVVVVLLRRERLFALQDPLTGAANRRAMDAYADRELQRCRRNQTPFTVVYMDCDNFKGLNDRWGHNVGDMLLRYIVKTTTAHVRATDLVARLGGDEFVVLLPSIEAANARRVCQELKRQLDEELANASCPATVSMGVVTFFPVPRTVEALIEPADKLMYQVKKSGKNHIEFQEI